MENLTSKRGNILARGGKWYQITSVGSGGSDQMFVQVPSYAHIVALLPHAAGKPGNVHVVVDGHLVSGQNEQSTLTAVQNLILSSNAR